MASSPVLVGYSLVGVYPCAVWKPRRASSPSATASNPQQQQSVQTQAPGPAPGPIRTTRQQQQERNQVRTQPYPTTATFINQPPPPSAQVNQLQQHRVVLQHPQQQQHHCTPTPIFAAPPALAVQQTTLANQLPPARPAAASCSCRDSNANIEQVSQVTANPAPMLFVPFSVPSFAPSMTGNNLHVNNCSPSKVLENLFT